MQMKDPDNSMMNHRSINGLVYCEFVGGGEKDEKWLEMRHGGADTQREENGM